ncbi:MAG: two-component system response regulator GlrR [Oceanospirillaceae bacterium]|nr:two-component system response regulator GlrR [Oceanospirillaceae bacterium]
MTAIPQILLVDQEPEQLQHLNDVLLSAGYRVRTAGDGNEALQVLETLRIELVLCDQRTSGRDGLTLNEQIQQDFPGITRILLINQSVMPEALEATAQGAFGILAPPYDPAHLLDTVRAALDTAHQRRDQRWRERIVGRSASMEHLLDQARRVAVSDVNLTISGPLGSGKELLAEAVHRASRRSEGPLEVISCSELPQQMLEAELFGHTSGAISGSSSQQPGLLTRTRGGTLILNEICDLSPALQSKLLMALQTARSRALGADREESLDVRIIATSSRNLEHAMLGGELNDELYYELSGVSLEIPALQERAEDIPVLARHFLKEAALRHNRRVRNLSPGAIHLLGLSAWPGNVTQLKGVIEQVVAQSGSPVVSEALVAKALDNQERVIPSFNEARAEFERRYLIKLLQITEGNVTHAARIAQRNRTDLYKLLGKHDLEPARFKVRRSRTSRKQTADRTGTSG